MFNILRDSLDALVHPSARFDALACARHRAFMAPRLGLSLAALAIFPIYLAASGAPTLLDAAAFATVTLPILSSYYLSRTGKLDHAQMMSSLAMAALVALVSVMNGSLIALAAVWLVIIPLEAVLAGSRRVLIVSSIAALVAAVIAGLAGAAAPVIEFGHLMTVNAIAAIIYTSAVAIGVAATSRAGEALLAAETRRYDMLASNMTDIVARHRRNGDVIGMSPTAQTVLGVPAIAMHGNGLFERVHVADRPAYLTALSSAAMGAEQRVEFRLRRDASRISMVDFVWVEMICRPVAGEGDAVVVSIMRDISERKRNEEMLARASADVARGDAVKSEFLATVSHELRTPLNAIIGFSEMIAHEKVMPLDAARREEYAKLIGESGRHLLSVVNGILDMSKIDAGKFEIETERFAPRPALLNCCDLLALKAMERDIEIVTRAPLELPDVVADQRAFKQILLNLVSNAVKFSDRGDTVTVSATSDEAHLVVSVSDTGVGIDAEDLKRIGDPFFQAGKNSDHRQQGTGLGLSIVKNLVAMHGGEMTVESRLDEGTTITVKLPLEPATKVNTSDNVATLIMPTRNVPSETICQVRKIA